MAVRAASRVGREPAPDADAVTVDADRARWWRLAVTHAADRLAAGGASLAEAAWGGLQDSAPHAGLLALHARADGVAPGAWEAPELAQVWLRQADHLVRGRTPACSRWAPGPATRAGPAPSTPWPTPPWRPCPPRRRGPAGHAGGGGRPAGAAHPRAAAGGGGERATC